MKKYAWVWVAFVSVMIMGVSPILAVVSLPIRLGPRAAVPEARRFMMQLQYKMKDPKVELSKEEEADLEQAFRVLGRSGMGQYNAIKKEITRRKSIVPIRVEEVKKEKPIEKQVIEVKQTPSEVQYVQTAEFKTERAKEEKDRNKKIYDECGKGIIASINQALQSLTYSKDGKYENELAATLKKSIRIGNTSKELSLWLEGYDCDLGDGNGSQRLAMKTDDATYIDNVNNLIKNFQQYLNAVENEKTSEQDLPIRLNKGLENINKFIVPIDSQEELKKIDAKIQTIKKDVDKRVKELEQITKTNEAREDELKAKELGKKILKTVVGMINSSVMNGYTADGILTQDLSVDNTKKKIQEWLLDGYSYKNKDYKLVVDQTYDQAIDAVINSMNNYFSGYALDDVSFINDYRDQQKKQLKALKMFIDRTSDNFKKTFQSVAEEIDTIVTNKISLVEAEHKKEEQQNAQQVTEDEIQRGKNYNKTAIKMVTDNIANQLNSKKKATEILAVSFDMSGTTKTIEQFIKEGYRHGNRMYPLIGDSVYTKAVFNLSQSLTKYVSNKEEAKKANSQQAFNNELNALDVFIKIIPDHMKEGVLKARGSIEQIIKTQSKEVKAEKVYKGEKMLNQQQKEQTVLQQSKKTKEALPFNTNNAFVNALKDYANKDIGNESPITYVNNLMNTKLNTNQTLKEILGLYTVTLNNEKIKYVSAIIKKVYDEIVRDADSESQLPAWAKDSKIVTTLGEAIDSLRMLADLGSDFEQDNNSILNHSVSLAETIVEKQNKESK